MAGGAERGDVVGPEVLHLVDEDRDAATLVGSEPAEVGEQLDQVDLDVAGVGPAPDRRRVDAGMPAVPELGARARVALGEGPDDAEDVGDRLLVGVPELADGLVQRRGERPAQALVGPGLELAGPPATAYGGRAQGVEQHGLADAAESGQHDAPLRAPVGDPLQHHVERRQLRAPAGQLGRALAGAGRVRVADRVHARTVSGSLADSVDFRPGSSTARVEEPGVGRRLVSGRRSGRDLSRGQEMSGRRRQVGASMNISWSVDHLNQFVSTLELNELDCLSQHPRSELQVDRPVHHDARRPDRDDQLLDPADRPARHLPRAEDRPARARQLQLPAVADHGIPRGHGGPGRHLRPPRRHVRPGEDVQRRLRDLHASSRSRSASPG